MSESQKPTYNRFSIFSANPLHREEGKKYSKAIIPPQDTITDCLSIARCFGWLAYDAEKQMSWLLYDYFIWPVDEQGEYRQP